MLYLALSVFCSSLIFVIFKLFSVYKVETLYAIITNYVVAGTVGLLFYRGDVLVTEIPQEPWFWGTVLLGMLFILVFNLIATTAQKAGISVASIATKMSLVIPVVFGVFIYKEELSILKIIGILLALSAVYFASIKKRSVTIKKFSLLLPISAFLGSGIIDASIKYIQEVHINEEEFPLFSAIVFASAATTGIVYILIISIKKPLKINVRNLLAGLVLGLTNYFSIYFLLKALQHPDLNSASLFTINNVAVVMFSTLLGILLFKEHISLKNWGGIALAVVSILLVALS